jgi:toxin ParE1/3/4
VDAIKAEFDPLRRFPLMGPLRAQFGPNLRVVFHSHYAIYYVPGARELIIVRVPHGARDAAAIAKQGGFKP